jgi:hypothetical protein
MNAHLKNVNKEFVQEKGGSRRQAINYFLFENWNDVETENRVRRSARYYSFVSRGNHYPQSSLSSVYLKNSACDIVGSTLFT